MPFSEFSPEELLGPLNTVEKKQAPRRLYVAGDTSLLRGPARVSVVGARDATQEGLRRAGDFVRILTQHGVTVVSGLAEGIDTTAHESAIAHGGRTIAVLGTPLDQYYPAKNQRLQDLLAREHLLVSQFTPGSHVGRKNFPMRNRTMALLSDATVIVEARDGSGTLHQGWEALRLGRPLFLMESLLQDKALAWTREMVSYGAEPLSRENLELFFELLPEGSRDERASFSL